MKRIFAASALAGALLGGSITTPMARVSVAESAQGPWTEIGAQTIVGETWNFDSQAMLAADQTFLRVTVGSCEGEPGGFLMEGPLQREAVGRMGIGVWSGP